MRKKIDLYGLFQILEKTQLQKERIHLDTLLRYHLENQKICMPLSTALAGPV